MNAGEAPIDNESAGFSLVPDPPIESDPVFIGERFIVNSPRIESPGLLRRLAGRWSQILMLWLLISAPIILLIYALVKPTYLATSYVRVAAPVGRSLTYLQGQVATITSDRVLDAAIASPQVVNLPTIKRFELQRKDLREKLNVEIIGDTSIIRIALELSVRSEVIAIVDAVTQAYLTQNRDQSRPAMNRVTEEQLLKLIEHQVQYHRDYRAAQAYLEAAKADRNRNEDQISEELLARVSEEFLKLPDVAILVDEIDETRNLAGSKFLTPPPKVVDARRRLPRLLKKYEKLWISEYYGIRERSAKGVRAPLSEARIQELEVAVVKARRKKESFAKQLEGIEVVGNDVDHHMHSTAQLKSQLNNLIQRGVQLKKNQAQLMYEPIHDEYLVSVIESASASRSPANNKRLQYMAAVPVVVVLLLLGSFLAHEIAGGRKDEQLPD